MFDVCSNHSKPLKPTEREALDVKWKARSALSFSSDVTDFDGVACNGPILSNRINRKHKEAVIFNFYKFYILIILMTLWAGTLLERTAFFTTTVGTAALQQV
jgi:hypothetical protein